MSLWFIINLLCVLWLVCLHGHLAIPFYVESLLALLWALLQSINTIRTIGCSVVVVRWRGIVVDIAVLDIAGYRTLSRKYQYYGQSRCWSASDYRQD